MWGSCCVERRTLNQDTLISHQCHLADQRAEDLLPILLAHLRARTPLPRDTLRIFSLATPSIFLRQSYYIGSFLLLGLQHRPALLVQVNEVEIDKRAELGAYVRTASSLHEDGCEWCESWARHS
jgi:hypothetical protein